MSQGGRINVLKLGMNNPSESDHDLPIRKVMIRNSFTVIKFKYKTLKSDKHKALKDNCYSLIQDLVALVKQSFSRNSLNLF